MTTPEGRTKAELRKLIGRYDGMYTYWPVPSGYGAKTVDVLGCYRGRFFSVETKAEGKKPTQLQVKTMQEIEGAMGKAFVMAGPEDPAFEDLRAWLDWLSDTVVNDPHITPDPVSRRPL